MWPAPRRVRQKAPACDAPRVREIKFKMREERSGWFGSPRWPCTHSNFTRLASGSGDSDVGSLRSVLFDTLLLRKLLTLLISFLLRTCSYSVVAQVMDVTFVIGSAWYLWLFQDPLAYYRMTTISYAGALVWAAMLGRARLVAVVSGLPRGSPCRAKPVLLSLVRSRLAV